MDLGHPLAVVTPTVDGDVLRVLAQAHAAFTPGQVAKLVDEHSLEGVRHVLVRLAGQGIVTRQAAGRAYLYQLNRDHLAAGPIVALANLRGELLDRLAGLVKEWASRPLYGALFGSSARSDMRLDSDLDVFLVHEDDVDENTWSRQVDDLATLATRWTGNDARVIAYSDSEVRRLGDGEPLLVNVRDEGLPFVGDPSWLRRAVRGARRPAGTS